MNVLEKLKRFLTGRRLQSGPRFVEVDGTYPCGDDKIVAWGTLNPMQSAFRDHYNPNRNFILEAGTGTGKTVAMYIASRHFLDAGKKVIVMAPTRELVKSLYREAMDVWGAKLVGLASGWDRRIEGKYVVVTTPEGYLSGIRSRKEWIDAALLVADEAHNLFDPSRGGNLDAAICQFLLRGGSVLLMSATLPDKENLAGHLRADLLVSHFVRTRIHKNEIEVVDDFDIRPDPRSFTGYSVKGESLRLKALKSVLQPHRERGEIILVFVPEKAVGYCLQETLVAPFHSADLDDETRDKVIRDFRSGENSLLIATSTLSQGVNTPADVVVICGTRSGGHYKDFVEVGQMMGRAGRGRDEAHVYLLGDKIEHFHAKNLNIARSLPLPVEALVLTELSDNYHSKAELIRCLERTYAASLAPQGKVEEAVERYLWKLKNFRILDEKNGKYSLTKEGYLLSRYFLSPPAYIGYMKLARRILAFEEESGQKWSDLDKGCILLGAMLPGKGHCPAKLEKDFNIKLLDLGYENIVRASRVGMMRHCMNRPSAMPRYFHFQLRDTDRWLSMFADMQRFGVHPKGVPGAAWLERTVQELKKSAYRNFASKRPKRTSNEQLRLSNLG